MPLTSQKENVASKFHTRSPPGSRWKCKKSKLKCWQNIKATRYASSAADTCLSLVVDTTALPNFMTRSQISPGAPWVEWMWRGSSIPVSPYQTKSMSSAALVTGKQSIASKSKRCQAMTQKTGPEVPGRMSYWRKVLWSRDTMRASLFFQTVICWLLVETRFTESATKWWSLIQRKGPSSIQLERMRIRLFRLTTHVYKPRET